MPSESSDQFRKVASLFLEGASKVSLAASPSNKAIVRPPTRKESHQGKRCRTVLPAFLPLPVRATYIPAFRRVRRFASYREDARTEQCQNPSHRRGRSRPS